jgi:hypothetical protein
MPTVCVEASVMCLVVAFSLFTPDFEDTTGSSELNSLSCVETDVLTQELGPALFFL